MARIQLECIIFRRDNNIEYLLLKRTPEKGGFWQPVAGGLELNESRLEGVFREIAEETGIRREDILRVIPEVFYFEMNRHYLTGEPIPLIKEYVYGVEVRPTARVNIHDNLSREHTEYAWVSYEDALRMLKWDDNINALRALHILLIRTF
ncbi:NUDIX pyrophosphatase [Candidatus Woesearchaeota archaeon]|nr:NUDIX pyrophosphatase [Candidatus Woesearchaeota archaeon]